MRIKNILTILLLIFVAGSLAYMVTKESKNKPSDKDNNSVMLTEKSESQIADYLSSDSTDNRLIVYYFHGDVRCPTCHKLESYAKESLDTYFANEIASNRISWKPVNIDKNENSHYVRDYNLITKSIILSKVSDGKEVEWKNLDKIWQEVHDKEGYLQYIRESVNKTLASIDS